MPAVVGIGTGFVEDLDYRIVGYPRMTLNLDYARSVEEAGGVPLTLPIVSTYESVRQQLRGVDAVILSGGNDVDPAGYGQAPNELLGPITPIRDAYERLLIRAAVDAGLPILGICRGLQILNVHFGGSLHQDLSLRPGESLAHSGDDIPTGDRHMVTIAGDSWLGGVVGETRLEVNSIHHQVVDRLADGFVATATADDGVVEAIEYRGPSRIVAVQWHPEMLSAVDVHAQALFRAFIDSVEPGA